MPGGAMSGGGYARGAMSGVKSGGGYVRGAKSGGFSKALPGDREQQEQSSKSGPSKGGRRAKGMQGCPSAQDTSCLKFKV